MGRERRLKVKTRSRRQMRVLPGRSTPYLGVRTNSLGLRRMALQMASSTALALLMLMPTPRAIRNGMYSSVFQPASRPNSSRWPKTKNVLAEQVARTKRLALKMCWLQV